MPRNGSGVYSLPNSAFVSGTVIASAPVNGNFSDIASALTQSISLDGQTTLTGSIKFLNGTAASPGVTFGGDATTGIYLSSAGTLGIAASGSSVGTWTTSGLAGATIVSPTISSPTVTNGTFSNPTATGTITAAAATFSGAVTTNGSLTVNGALTMASPVSVANGGTGDTSLTAYAVMCGGTTTTNPVQSVAGLGSTGQVLTSNGAGALPTFQNQSMVLLNTLTASNSAVLSDTTSLTSTYSAYLLILTNLVPATTNVALEMQVHSGGTFQSTTYVASANIFAGTNTTSGSTLTTGQIFTTSTVTNGAGLGLVGTIWITNPSQTSSPKLIKGECQYNDAGAWVTALGGGYWNGGNGAVDGFQLFFSTGNISTGVVKIYGIP